MATYAHVIDGTRYVFADLRTLLARATPERSGDRLAGVAAASAEERVAAQMALADLPLHAVPARGRRALRVGRGHAPRSSTRTTPRPSRRSPT